MVAEAVRQVEELLGEPVQTPQCEEGDAGSGSSQVLWCAAELVADGPYVGFEVVVADDGTVTVEITH